MRCGNVLAFAALTMVAAIESPSTYSPFLMWSSNKIFEHPANDFAAIEANTEYSPAQIASTLSFLQDNDNALEDALNARTPFEVFYPRVNAVVLFVKDTLRLDEMEHFQDTPVETILRNATSSVWYPHTTRSSALVVGLKPDLVTDVSNVKTFLQGHSSFGSSTQTDLVVVHVSDKLSWTEAAKEIRAAVAMFDHVTSNKVIYGLTGDKAAAVDDDFHFVHRALLQAVSIATPLICPPGSYLSTAQAEPFCFTHYVNMTPTILAGLLLSFFFIFSVYVGLYALDSIQTPLKYPSIAPPKGKEY
ncbi:Aste57867_16025 [Aphanomyces stellatus]|uniref:Aste57867_16025 protein n=1 Tax=Aphanomyces stellatus TaxID=120398 RepID=A0A485L4J8_9STRA|nr:hypothetical protein As57867_015969 [Aphanomyces stellatus]VFT92810.1 Aste57867_16025 [Aphanomyces stellatus]